MISRSVLSKSFTVSLLLHAGFLGLLVLLASRPPVLSDTPLRVRILDTPGKSPVPQSVPQVIGPPPGRAPRGSSEEVERRGDRPAKEQVSRELGAGNREPRAGSGEGVSEQGNRVGKEVGPNVVEPSAPSAPRVAARPTTEPAVPRPERIPESPREASAPIPPERSGLSLAGPPQGALPRSAPNKEPLASGPVRPSLREQIASLGSSLTGDLGGTAKRTISLDSREEHFVEYLARLKRRVQRVWEYPEEAVQHGISGELLVVFTLNQAGSLTYIRLVQSSGYPILDEEALRAVKLAAPFDPFLPQMGDGPLNISATFHYDLPRRLRRN